MKAIVIDQYKETGSERDVAQPQPGANEIRVKISFAGVNPVDWKIRSGAMGGDTFPKILGQDFAGTVDLAGANVTRVKAGDRVFGIAREHGGYAQFTVVSQDDHGSPFSTIPAGVDDATAAALPTSSLTALAGLDRLKIGAGSDVLIFGAAGAVGVTAVQLAKRRGARVVAVVKPGQADTARDFGADLVVDVEGDPLETIRAKHPEPFATVLDLVNQDAALKGNRPLYATGAVVVTTVHAIDETWFRENGFEGVNLSLGESPASSPSGLDTLTAAVGDGTLIVPIAGQRELMEAGALLDSLERHELGGKYVLRAN